MKKKHHHIVPSMKIYTFKSYLSIQGVKNEKKTVIQMVVTCHFDKTFEKHQIEHFIFHSKRPQNQYRCCHALALSIKK